MKNYIAVTEIHDRPDTDEPMRVTKAGQPIALAEKEAKDLEKSGAIRAATEDEIRLFNLDEPAEPKADKGKKTEPKKDDAAKKSDDDDSSGLV